MRARTQAHRQARTHTHTHAHAHAHAHARAHSHAHAHALTLAHALAHASKHVHSTSDVPSNAQPWRKVDMTASVLVGKSQQQLAFVVVKKGLVERREAGGVLVCGHRVAS